MHYRIPHVVADRDRYGIVRLYYRRKGKPKVRLFETPGTEAFARELDAAKTATEAAPTRARDDAIDPASLRGLCLGYFKSSAFSLLDARTQRVRRLILESICVSSGTRGGERGKLPFAMMQARHVVEVRDEKKEKPEAANSRVKALRQLFKWAISVGQASANPAAPVALFPPRGDGFRTWSVEDVARYEERHPVGTKARLALALLLYTGVRRSDVCRLGPHMERDGALHFTPTKGATSKVRRAKDGPKVLALPILPELRAVLDASREHGGPFAYLTTDRGTAYTVESFGNLFRDWCREAGLPEGLAAHGLRKAAATRAAENGATEHEIMAIFGWDSPRQAALYTARANRKLLAEKAMHRLGRSAEVVPLNQRRGKGKS